jgi:CheY-like chemotaxis protein
MQRYNILWADDEIDLLKPHIIFLNTKGYDVTPVYNAADAIEKCTNEKFDIVFMDENMPGMSGLEALNEIKAIKPNLPVVMITKNEEEHIMEEAIGAKIADYLIKPLNPNQILLSVKKILQNKQLVSEKTNQSYQQDFRNISMAFGDKMNYSDWVDIYKRLVYWELEIEKTEEKSMKEVLEMQKGEANANFIKFIKSEYESWLNQADIDKPLLSHQLFKKKIFPLLQEEGPLFFILIDNLRYDQWKVLYETIAPYYGQCEESLYYSILPTTTAYARNSIFAGILPSEIEKKYPNYWVHDDEEESKNNYEQDLLREQLLRNKLDIKFSYHKIITATQGKSLTDQVSNLLNNKLNVVVYNFVDMLSHARTDSAMIRELAPDEAAYRSVTQSWFQHSPLLELIKKLSAKNIRIVITTDHGTVRVKKPFKIIGDKNTNANLRYKHGKNLSYDKGDAVMEANKPERFFLPKRNMSSSYVFACGEHFFAYPNNYNHYVNYYKDTFQHGGVSIEEVIIPYIELKK